MHFGDEALALCALAMFWPGIRVSSWRHDADGYPVVKYSAVAPDGRVVAGDCASVVDLAEATVAACRCPDGYAISPAEARFP
jgi:hypothetical protein